ncbi:MAG: hypothetical protein K0S33_1616 [Bacteroidetes bacterium]|jgi:hypothetical protein|nr:hypothetical protein [Bacteroidota bacterium]
MKKIVLIAVGVILSLASVSAQTNNTLVVFSEGGERFYLILNGLRQNEVAATNVKAVALNQSVYKAKVIFEQKGLPDADKTMYMTWEGMDASNMEFVCSIKKDKKGKYKWSFVSTAPISASSPYASLQPSTPGVTGNASSTPVSNTGNTQAGTNTSANTNVNTSTNSNNTIGMNTSVGVNDNTSNTSVTTTTTTTQGAGGLNMGVNMNGTGININMNVSDPLLTGTGQTTTTTTSSTTTYTASSTTVSSSPSTTTTYSSSSTTVNTNNPAILTSTVTAIPTTTTTTAYSDNSSSTTNASVASSGCGYEMSGSDFASAKKSIVSKSFEDSKLTIAKQILNSNCMNTSQVKEIMDQFSFEQTKLDWAKFAYKKTTDRNNYFKINDGFTFEASIDELNDYISKVK